VFGEDERWDGQKTISSTFSGRDSFASCLGASSWQRSNGRRTKTSSPSSPPFFILVSVCLSVCEEDKGRGEDAPLFPSLVTLSRLLAAVPYPAANRESPARDETKPPSPTPLFLLASCLALFLGRKTGGGEDGLFFFLRS